MVESSKRAGGLLTPTDVRELARLLDITPTKKLGQNFVHDAGTVRKIVRLADVKPGQPVLEVGPGLGSLTLGLLEAGANVTAVEIDPTLQAALPKTVATRSDEWSGRLTTILGDGMRVTPEDVDQAGGAQPAVLVANLPYNVSVPIIFHMLRSFPSFESMLVMVQREVADRLVAQRGTRTYGSPTVKLSWYGNPRFAGVVGPNVFWPRPNVDSALVQMNVIQNRFGDPLVREATFRIVDAAFAQRRKMLRSSLRTLFGSATKTNQILTEGQVEGTLRAEQLDIEQYLSIAKAATAAGWRDTP